MLSYKKIAVIAFALGLLIVFLSFQINRTDTDRGPVYGAPLTFYNCISAPYSTISCQIEYLGLTIDYLDYVAGIAFVLLIMKFLISLTAHKISNPKVKLEVIITATISGIFFTLFTLMFWVPTGDINGAVGYGLPFGYFLPFYYGLDSISYLNFVVDYVFYFGISALAMLYTKTLFIAQHSKKSA